MPVSRANGQKVKPAISFLNLSTRNRSTPCRIPGTRLTLIAISLKLALKVILLRFELIKHFLGKRLEVLVFVIPG